MASECGSVSTTTPGPFSPLSDPLPLVTEDEELLIGQIRRTFAVELAKRQAEGRDHQCFLGQYALARVLRGNDGDLIAAQAWLRNFFAKAREANLDVLMSEMAAKLDASPDGAPADTMLPYADEVSTYIRAIFTAPKPTPDGGPVNYIPLARFNKRAIYTDLEWSHFVRYMHGATVLRIIECDRLSMKQKRALQVVTVFDLAGCGISDLVNPKFDMAYSRDVASFQTQVAAEIFGPVYLVNAPRFVVDLYWLLFRLLPERFRTKIHVVQDSGLEDPDFVHLVGGEQQLRRMFSFRESMEMGASSPSKLEEEAIARRRSFSCSVDVARGQRVSWRFQVLAGHGDGLLGDSDLSFSVRGLWTERSEQDSMPASGQQQYQRLTELLKRAIPEGLVNRRRVKASRGTVSGSHLAERPGVVTLTWCNRHSFARAKVLRYSVQVSSGRSVEDGPRSPGAGTPRDLGEERGGMWCCVGRPPAS